MRVTEVKKKKNPPNLHNPSETVRTKADCGVYNSIFLLFVGIVSLRDNRVIRK